MTWPSPSQFLLFVSLFSLLHCFCCWQQAKMSMEITNNNSSNSTGNNASPATATATAIQFLLQFRMIFPHLTSASQLYFFTEGKEFDCTIRWPELT